VPVILLPCGSLRNESGLSLTNVRELVCRISYAKSQSR
jgi:hypothetical protein